MPHSDTRTPTTATRRHPLVAISLFMTVALLAPRRAVGLRGALSSTSVAATPAPQHIDRLLAQQSSLVPQPTRTPTPPRLEPLFTTVSRHTTAMLDPVPLDPYHRQTNGMQDDRRRTYQLNLGKAIDAVRTDVQHMFEHEPDMSIFAEEVALTDRSGNVLLRGKSLYSGLYGSLRLAKRLTLSQPQVRVINVRFLDWIDEISVRFSVVMPGPLGLEPIHFDAVSVYRVDDRGMIFEHRVDDVFRNHFFIRAPAFQQFALPIQNAAWGGPVVGI